MEQTANKELKPKLFTGNYLKVWIANFMMYFSFYFVTPLLPLYLRDVYHADKAMIGLVLSGYSIAALAIRFFSGYIVDRFSRKKVLLIGYASFALFFLGYYITGSIILFAVIRTLHGAPFGLTSVSSNTVAIDVLPSQRRGEGIGYWGLSNNFAMAIGPSLSLMLYSHFNNYNLLFTVSLIVALLGLFINTFVDCKYRPPIMEKKKMSLDRFLLIEGWSQGICIAFVAMSYGILSTYIAIYSQDVMNITTGTGTFFMLFSFGLILSRFVGVKALSRGYAVRNATYGVIVVAVGYMMFAFWQNLYGYYISAVVIGFGQASMYPAVQTMFLNMTTNDKRGTANATILTSWDLGVGLGIIFGGYVAEHLGGYNSAFLMSAIVSTLSVIFFLSYAKKDYLDKELSNS
ncbi:MAG: MFS transporter [Bacteroidales bacterium]|nr:MFS transporter [Bacteroidales bacterium]MBO5853939.1 MFS transporter [Bacteroidales bacterium]